MASVAEVTSRDHLIEFQARARSLQERADNALEPWSIRAPSLVAGESLGEYRRRLLILAKKQLPSDHDLRRVQVRQLASDALAVFEPQIYQACKLAAYRPDSVPPGTLRCIEEKDQNGLTINRFVGPTWFGAAFCRPGRKARIRNPDQDPGWFRR
jgi:hypothetical protein